LERACDAANAFIVELVNRLPPSMRAPPYPGSEPTGWSRSGYK
jgi:hypothetical protein